MAKIVIPNSPGILIHMVAATVPTRVGRGDGTPVGGGGDGAVNT